jgi:hypothetical protein
MPDISKPNGGYSGPSLPEATGYPTMVPRFRAPLPAEVRVESASSSARLEPEALYKVYSAEMQEFVVDAPVALISQMIGKSVIRLKDALKEEDELQRENHISVGVELFWGVCRFIGTSEGLDDVLSVILAALGAHRSVPYSRAELVAVIGVLEKVRRNPIPSQAELSLICDSLEQAGFDINAPLAQADLQSE